MTTTEPRSQRPPPILISAGPGQQPVGGIGGRHAAPGKRQPQDQQQPADRVEGSAAGQHCPGRGRAHRRQDGANGSAEGELGQVGSAGLARQVVQPGDHWDGEHGQRPQRPCRHTRPPAWSGASGRRSHGHGPWRISALGLVDIGTSLVGRWSVWPPSVSGALRTPGALRMLDNRIRRPSSTDTRKERNGLLGDSRGRALQRHRDRRRRRQPEPVNTLH